MNYIFSAKKRGFGSNGRLYYQQRVFRCGGSCIVWERTFFRRDEAFRVEGYVHPGQSMMVVRERPGHVLVDRLTWDNFARDERGNCGFVSGFRGNFSARCLIPATEINFPEERASDRFVPMVSKKGLFFLAGIIHDYLTDHESVSILTAPTNETTGEYATAPHQPILIGTQNGRVWLDPTVETSSLQHAPCLLPKHQLGDWH